MCVCVGCSLKRVVSEIDKREVWAEEEVALLTKFRKTTVRHLQKLEDEAPQDVDILGMLMIVVVLLVSFIW